MSQEVRVKVLHLNGTPTRTWLKYLNRVQCLVFLESAPFITLLKQMKVSHWPHYGPWRRRRRGRFECYTIGISGCADVCCFERLIINADCHIAQSDWRSPEGSLPRFENHWWIGTQPKQFTSVKFITTPCRFIEKHIYKGPNEKAEGGEQPIKTNV